MAGVNLTYRFRVDDRRPQDGEDFWVLLFHEVLYDAPKPLNFAGWFADCFEVYEQMRDASQAPDVHLGRPLTWPRMTVTRRSSRDEWTVQIEGRPAQSGHFGLRLLFG